MHPERDLATFPKNILDAHTFAIAWAQMSHILGASSHASDSEHKNDMAFCMTPNWPATNHKWIS